MTQPRVHEVPSGAAATRPSLADYSTQVLRTMSEMLRRRPPTEPVARALAWIEEELERRDG